MIYDAEEKVHWLPALRDPAGPLVGSAAPPDDGPHDD
jgi:hypothetical protein